MFDIGAVVEAHMPAVSVGLAEVEGRLQAIRRRLNSLTVQRAVYLTTTVATLGSAVVVAIALRGTAPLFDVALWCIIGAVGAATAYAGLRVNREWLSLDATARLADHRAALDDRLATLLASGRSSPLAPMLLEQLLTASRRWDVRALAPHRVARSVLLLVSSLAVLIATSFYARPPALPNPGGAAPSPRASADEEQALFRPAAGTGETSVLQPAGNDGGALSGHLDAAATGAAGHHSAASMVPSNQATGDSEEAAHTDASARHESVRSGMNEQLRQAIRQTLGATDGNPTDAFAGHRDDRGPASGTDQHAARRAGPATGEPRGRPNSSTEAPRPTGSNGGGRNTSGAGVAGGTPGSEGLLAGNATARSKSAAKPALGIKLSAFNTLAPSQVEPQRQSPPVGNVVTTNARGALPELTDEQVPDAPLHKVDVAPQHEAIVQRIFTYDE